MCQTGTLVNMIPSGSKIHICPPENMKIIRVQTIQGVTAMGKFPKEGKNESFGRRVSKKRESEERCSL